MTRRFHDIGGLPGQALDPGSHPSERWGTEVTATFGALMRRRLIRLDEIRRAVEDLGPERYDALGYFERQTQATIDVLVEKGILTRAEIEQRIAELRSRQRE